MSSTIKLLVISEYHDEIPHRPEAEILLGLKRQGVDVTVMTKGESVLTSQFKQAGIPLIDYHPSKKYSRESIRFIRNELKQGQYNIVMMFNSKAYINGLFAAKRLPVKTVLYRGYTGNINWWDPIMYFKFLRPRVDKIFCLADSIRVLIQKNMIFGGKHKCVTVNKGHNPSWYIGVEPADLSEFGIKPSDFVVICVANARRMKGMKYLIESSYEIPEDASLHYLLVGRDMDTPEIMKLVNKSPIRDNIHFTGFRKDAQQLDKASDVFALASITGEATTKALLEAMSLGLAPVISDVPGNRGVVEDGKSGFVVPMKDGKAMGQAILKLYQNKELCREFGEAAKERMRTKFSTERTVQEYKHQFELLLSDGKDSAS